MFMKYHSMVLHSIFVWRREESRQFCSTNVYDLRYFFTEDSFHANFLVACNHPAERLAIFKCRVSSYSECDQGVRCILNA